MSAQITKVGNMSGLYACTDGSKKHQLLRAGDWLEVQTPHGNKLRGRIVMWSAFNGYVLCDPKKAHGGSGILADITNVTAFKLGKGPWHQVASVRRVHLDTLKRVEAAAWVEAHT